MLFALSANPTGNDFREDFAMRSETKPSQDEEKNGQEPLLPPIQPVIDFGSVVIKSSRAAIHCLTIAGQIEGHMLLPNTQKATKYEHVLPLLAYLEESEDIDGVLFLLNTVGGDVEAGLAIAELISGMKKPTVSLVLGGGHSIGVPLAVAPMVTMTIHPVRTSGTIIAAPQTYQYFERLQERIVRFVTKNSRIGRDEFLRLMMDTQDLASDVGSVLYGEEAVACGLIQHIGRLSDALDTLYALIDEKKK
jgi:ATP-dependent protease ClpP protease subunit